MTHGPHVVVIFLIIDKWALQVGVTNSWVSHVEEVETPGFIVGGGKSKFDKS